MFIVTQGARAHALTGGPTFDPTLPTVVFLHGAGMDATVWASQARWFAHHGYGALALDFPAHGRSGGAALTSIDAMADWVAAVLRATDAGPAAVVGHSMGSLVALSLAARHAELVRQLALIGTALEMKVGSDLLAAAEANNPDAHSMVNLWGHGARAGLGGCETPGVWMAGAGQRLLERARPGVLSSDLRACDVFVARSAALGVNQSVLILHGARDQMTPLKSAKALAETLPHARIEVFANAGHMLMVEESGRVLSSLAGEIVQSTRTSRTLTLPTGPPP